jgi:hypothetical protein
MQSISMQNNPTIAESAVSSAIPLQDSSASRNTASAAPAQLMSRAGDWLLGLATTTIDFFFECLSRFGLCMMTSGRV